MPSGAPVCQLRASARRISATGSISALWPTPTSGDGSGGHVMRSSTTGKTADGRKINVSLGGVARLVAAHGAKLDGSPDRTANSDGLSTAFVCWLMGLPLEVDACAPMATASACKSPRRSSRRSSQQSTIRHKRQRRYTALHPGRTRLTGACEICGEPDAPFGYEMGERWRCREHWPDRPPNDQPCVVERIPPPSPGQCIVCDGAKVWRDQPCWCCVERLIGPRLDAPESAADAPLKAAPRCVHCGLTGDVFGDRLLRLVCLGVEERGYVHARCWTALRRAEQEEGFSDMTDAAAPLMSKGLAR
jgi:hypothetical protein